MEETAIRLAQVRQLMADAARKSGRTAEQIELVAVSKTHAAEKVQEAIEAGQLLFGESRVQEARAKIPLLPSRLRWHFIGPLQANKTAAVARDRLARACAGDGAHRRGRRSAATRLAGGERGR